MNPTGKPQDTKQDTKAQTPGQDNPDLQGEGNYVAGRRYDQAQRKFVESGQVDEAARKAEPQNSREADEMDVAEREGRSHAKGEDPAVKPSR